MPQKTNQIIIKQRRRTSRVELKVKKLQYNSDNRRAALLVQIKSNAKSTICIIHLVGGLEWDMENFHYPKKKGNTSKDK